MTAEQKIKRLEKRIVDLDSKRAELQNQYQETRKRLDEISHKIVKNQGNCESAKREIQNLRLISQLPPVGSWWIHLPDLGKYNEFVIEHFTAQHDSTVEATVYRLETHTACRIPRQRFSITTEENTNSLMVGYVAHFKEITEEEAKRLIEIGQRCDNTPLGEIKYLKK